MRWLHKLRLRVRSRFHKARVDQQLSTKHRFNPIASDDRFILRRLADFREFARRQIPEFLENVRGEIMPLDVI